MRIAGCMEEDSMGCRWLVVSALGALMSGALLWMACGTSGPSAGVGDRSASDAGSAASDDTGGSDGEAPGDAAAGVFASSTDAGSPTASGPCKPGLYKGKFATTVTVGSDVSDASDPFGLDSLFALQWTGDIAVELRAQTVTVTTSAGELPTTTTTLEIADGGKLSGTTDNYGGKFTADLNGELDCSPDAGPPYRLSATLANGNYGIPALNYNILIGGSLAADYQGSTRPALVDGGMHVYGYYPGADSGPMIGGAIGDWSATWSSP
jgi:hypothetical protein